MEKLCVYGNTEATDNADYLLRHAGFISASHDYQLCVLSAFFAVFAVKISRRLRGFSQTGWKNWMFMETRRLRMAWIYADYLLRHAGFISASHNNTKKPFSLVFLVSS